MQEAVLPEGVVLRLEGEVSRGLRVGAAGEQIRGGERVQLPAKVVINPPGQNPIDVGPSQARQGVRLLHQNPGAVFEVHPEVESLSVIEHDRPLSRHG